MSTFRTRQAPSPTGYLHLGTARQVLFTKLFAIINNGTYYLRLEDTDRNRLNQGSATNLLQTLSQLYLLPDEGVTIKNEKLEGEVPPNPLVRGREGMPSSQNMPGEAGQTIVGPDEFYGVYQVGEYGPYIQSERLSLYHEHAQKLIDKGLAYWSYLTEEEKNELQEIKKINKRPINYYKLSLEKSGQEELTKSVIEGLADERKPVLRYKIQRDEKICCKDELVGESEFDLNLEEDFTILKSDGFPTYHLAHLVDDYLMETTLVFRAQEWYPSIVKHQVMFMDYWGAGPKYLHVPFIMGETGTKKMSKRDGNVNMSDYLDKGYLPEAIINYLAFLGWNPGTEQELYLESQDFHTLGQEERVNKLIHNIARDFSIDKLSKAPARFNLEKLNWFNREYIKMLSLHEFAYLADKIRLKLNKTDKPRVGDYVYLVDFEKQKTYMTCDQRMPGDGVFYPIGGGRENDPIDSLVREVEEESLGELVLDRDKLISFENFYTNKPFVYHDGESWTGKQMFFYVYNLSTSAIKPKILPDTVNEWFYDWVNLADVIRQNRFVRFSLWQNFCDRHDLPMFAIEDWVAEYYLAYLLDKNRVTVLSEIGADSDCVLYYATPDEKDLQWKKISLEQSLANLSEILAFVETQKVEMKAKQDKLYEMVKAEINEKLKMKNEKSGVEQQFALLVGEWESRIKAWLKEGGRDTGAYLWPLRVHLSGKAKSPSPFELLAVRRG